MRYFSYNERDVENDSKTVVTVSEEDVRDQYYPYWYQQMCDLYGKAHVDKIYSFEDCLCDWQAINRAWEVGPTEESQL